MSNIPCSSEVADAVASVIAHRRSIRAFNNKPIPKEILDRLVRAGIDAPSGSNWQNQRFLVISDAEEIMRIGKQRFVWPYKGANIGKVKEAHPGGILGHSAALIIVFADSRDNDRRGNGEYHIWQVLEIQNCAASIQNILLLATALGLGSCWISASDSMNFTRMFSGGSWRKMLSEYDLPLHYKLQGIVMLGYPKSKTAQGFAKGESMHGATVWQSTKRKPIDNYLVGKKSAASALAAVTFTDALLVKVYSTVILLLHRALSHIDKLIHRIEIDKYFRKL